MSTWFNDFAVAILAILLGGYALSQTGEMSELGAVFPTTAAICLIAAGLALALRSIMRRHYTAPSSGQIDWMRLAGLAPVLAGWALLFKPLGFIVSAALGMTLIALLSARSRISLSAIGLAYRRRCCVGQWCVFALYTGVESSTTLTLNFHLRNSHWLDIQREIASMAYGGKHQPLNSPMNIF